MNFTDQNIYKLLPSIYRVRDAERGEPLKALIKIIAEQARVSEKDIAGLYENWFIETCEEWVVPYIGDLLGVRNFHAISGSSVISQRAYVANTLSYRRRKGIAPVLEQLALDIAGWRAHVVEFFELLAATQYMNHIRLHRPVCPDMRKMNQLDLLNSAFDTIAHTVDVRHIASGRGKHNIPNIGIFTWRLQSYPVAHSDARKMDWPATTLPMPSFYFTFDPLGNDTQLFNRPRTETSITHISTEINVPGLLRRRALFDELEARRQAIVDGVTPVYNYFDDRLEIEGDLSSRKHPVFEIFPNDQENPIAPEKILICNLTDPCVPPTEKIYKKLKEDGTYEDQAMPITVVVDPVLGRFIFTDPASVENAEVSYSYGFSGDTGSGTFNRQGSIPAVFQDKNVWHVGVSKNAETVGDENIFKTVQEAIDKWNARGIGSTGVITIMDNHSYDEALTITIKEKSQLLIIAADWPVREDPLTLVKKRIAGDMTASDLRPHISGSVKITGMPDLTKKTGGEITFDGLLIDDKCSVLKGNLGALTIANCTLVPDSSGLSMGVGTTDPLSNQWLQIKIRRCISGALNLRKTSAVLLTVEDSIIHSVDDPPKAIDAIKTPTDLRNTTIFGQVHTKTIDIDNCIITDETNIDRRQTGCVRFSYVPFKSKTPRRYRCQPEQENDTIVPAFTSMLFGHHAYGQLSATCPTQISSGADNASEMGAFNYLQQPQRQTNLHIALDEYLPLGLEAGVIYVT